jgi:hypothetical protein
MQEDRGVLGVSHTHPQLHQLILLLAASLVYLTSQFHSICKELEELEERADGDTLRNALLLRNKERREVRLFPI